VKLTRPGPVGHNIGGCNRSPSNSGSRPSPRVTVLATAYEMYLHKASNEMHGYTIRVTLTLIVGRIFIWSKLTGSCDTDLDSVLNRPYFSSFPS